MVWWWWIIPGALAVVGLAFALSGLGWMFKGRPLKGGRGVVIGAVPLSIAAIAGLVGLNIQTYNRLSHEAPVATVALDQIGGPDSREFQVTVTELNEQGEPLGQPQVYTLTGDQWQMDARVISWKPWANVLGLDAQYELQRIWGRNVTGPQLTAEGQRMHVERPGIDVFAVARNLGGLSPIEAAEREFGSATFMPMVDDAVYNVKITQEALVAEAGNDVARGAIAAGRLRMGYEGAAQSAPAATPAP